MTSLLRIEAGRPVAEGRLLSRTADGTVLLLSGALPGETVEASVTEEGKGYRVARTERVLVPSPDRVAPPCPLFGRCGGCTLQFARYPIQVEMKREALSDVLRRQGGVAEADGPATPSPLPFGYRHRCRVHLRRGRAGFLAAASHDVVDVPRCLLLPESLNRLLPLLPSLSPKGKKGEAHLLTDGRRSLAWLPGRKRDRGVWLALREAGCAGVRFADGSEGDPSLPLPVAGLPLRASAGAFVQANRGANDLLVARARALLAAGGPVSHLLDLYAGGGNFALPLASLAERVTAVESGEESFRDLQGNRDGLSLPNCRLVRAPVEDYRPEGAVDALLVDPPRTGLSRGALKALRAASPRRILYVSCDPATLARDLRLLSPDYRTLSVELFDLFPQTHHAETLSLLLPR